MIKNSKTQDLSIAMSSTRIKLKKLTLQKFRQDVSRLVLSCGKILFTWFLQNL